MSKVHLPDLSKDELVQLVKRLNGQIKFLQQQGAPTGIMVGPNGTINNQSQSGGHSSHNEAGQVESLQSHIKQLKQENVELNMRLKSTSEQATLIREELTTKTDEVRALGKQIALLSDQLVDSQATVDQLLKRQQEMEEESALRARISSVNKDTGSSNNLLQLADRSIKGHGGKIVSSSASESGALSPKLGSDQSFVSSATRTQQLQQLQANGNCKLSTTVQAERTIMNLQLRIIELEETLEFYATIVQSQDARQGPGHSLLGSSSSQGSLKDASLAAALGFKEKPKRKMVSNPKSGVGSPFDPFTADNKGEKGEETERHDGEVERAEDDDKGDENTTKTRQSPDIKAFLSAKKMRQIIQQLYEECTTLRQEGDALRLERNKLRKRMETIDGLVWFASDIKASSPNNMDSAHGEAQVPNTLNALASAHPHAIQSPLEEGTAATIVHEFDSRHPKPSALKTHSEAPPNVIDADQSSTRTSGVSPRPSILSPSLSTNTSTTPSFLQNLLGTATKYTTGALPVANSLLGRGRNNNSSANLSTMLVSTQPGNNNMSSQFLPSDHNSSFTSSHLPVLNLNSLPDKNLKGTISSREQKLLDRINAVEAYLEQLLQYNDSRQRNYNELDRNRAELFASLNEKLQSQKEEIVRLTKALSQGPPPQPTILSTPVVNEIAMPVVLGSAIAATHVDPVEDNKVDDSFLQADTKSAHTVGAATDDDTHTFIVKKNSTETATQTDTIEKANIGVSAFGPVMASSSNQTEAQAEECRSVGLSQSVSELPESSGNSSSTLVAETEKEKRKLKCALVEAEAIIGAQQLELEFMWVTHGTYNSEIKFILEDLNVQLQNALASNRVLLRRRADDVPVICADNALSEPSQTREMLSQPAITHSLSKVDPTFLSLSQQFEETFRSCDGTESSTKHSDRLVLIDQFGDALLALRCRSAKIQSIETHCASTGHKVEDDTPCADIAVETSDHPCIDRLTPSESDFKPLSEDVDLSPKHQHQQQQQQTSTTAAAATDNNENKSIEATHVMINAQQKEEQPASLTYLQHPPQEQQPAGIPPPPPQVLPPAPSLEDWFASPPSTVTAQAAQNKNSTAVQEFDPFA